MKNCPISHPKVSKALSVTKGPFHLVHHFVCASELSTFEHGIPHVYPQGYPVTPALAGATIAF